MTDNVIHLEFKSPHVADDERGWLACRNCRNKTYLLVSDKRDTFPLLQCCACGEHIGRMGWAHDDDPLTANTQT
jgi:hypothetical protein